LLFPRLDLVDVQGVGPEREGQDEAEAHSRPSGSEGVSSLTNLFPGKKEAALEAYLRRALAGATHGHSTPEGLVHLVGLRRLAKSTRDAPWLLEAEVGGALRRYVLRFGETSRVEHEYGVLRAMEPVPVATPKVYGCDLTGEALGSPCFLLDFVEGDSLLGPMRAGESWAEELYLDSVCALQSVTAGQLGTVGERLLPGQSAVDILEETRIAFQEHPHPLADPAYARLKETMPELPELRFSNGDLYLDNFLVRDRSLAGVIDFEHAGFSDPVYEFLLSFFIHPELRGRGIEERYCRRIGVDPGALHWYHGLEYFELLGWAVRTGRSFEGHTAESLGRDLCRWLRPRRRGAVGRNGTTPWRPAEDG